MNGYHEFYRSTLLHKGIALHTVSLWNTIILALQTLMQDQYGPSFFEHCPKDFFSPTTYIVIFSAFETVFLMVAHGWYVLRVNRFNKATPAPDAFRGLSENMNSVRFSNNLSPCFCKQRHKNMMKNNIDGKFAIYRLA